MGEILLDAAFGGAMVMWVGLMLLRPHVGALSTLLGASDMSNGTVWHLIAMCFLYSKITAA